MDHGFYYDDPEIAVVVAPVQQVQAEWRFVVIGKEVVTGSGYVADSRVIRVNPRLALLPSLSSLSSLRLRASA